MRRRIIARRGIEAVLPLNDEITAAGMLHCFWTEERHRSRSWWASVKHVHGQRIADKVRATMPGCRPGFEYAVGTYPPLPLVEPIPDDHMARRDQIVIEGMQHWFCGGPWQRCQAEHLRDLGEVDGAEWDRFVRWRDAGFPAEYRADHDPTGRPVDIVLHCCW